MEALEIERAAGRRNVLRQIGIPDLPRSFTAQAATMGHEAAVMALQYFDGEAQALQDPVTGAAYFMAGVSAAGGSDPVGAP